MGATVRVVQFAAPSGGSYPQAQVVSVPSGQRIGAVPSAAFVGITGAVNLETIGSTSIHGIVGVGFSDFTRSRAMAYTAEHNVSATSADTGYRIDDATIVQLPTGTSEALKAEATIAATGTDQVTLTWSADPTGAECFVLLVYVGGTAAVYVGTGTSSGTAGNSVNVTAPGFAADDVLFASVDQTMVADGSGNGAQLSFGFWSRAANRNACGCVLATDRVTPTSTGAEYRDDSCVVTLSDSAGTISETQRLSANTHASGFTVLSNASRAVDFIYLAIKHGGTSYVDAPDTDVTALAQVHITAPGFLPNFACLVGGRAGLNTISSGTGPISIAVVDPLGNIGCVAATFQDNRSGANLSVAASYASVVDVFVAMSTAAAYDWKGDWDAFTTSGFDFTVNDTAASSRSIPYLAAQLPVVPVSSDTEQISDGFAFRISHKRTASDTENITDSALFVVTSTRRALSETEQIGDTFAFATTDRRTASDSEQIQDAFAFATTDRKTFGDTEQLQDAFVYRITDRKTFSDTEQIADGFVFSLSSATTTRVSSDTEDILDTVALIVGRRLISSDTENISDGFVTVLTASAGTIVAAETERISDGAVLLAQVASRAFQDVERITDTSILILGRVLVSSDSERISDSANTGAGLLALKRTLRGTVYG